MNTNTYVGKNFSTSYITGLGIELAIQFNETDIVGSYVSRKFTKEDKKRGYALSFQLEG